MAKKQNVSVSHPIVKPTTDKKPTGFYKLSSTPRGISLFTYTIGAFMALGIFTGKRKVFQKADLVKFFQTNRVYTHHKSAGNFEETKTGVRMTVAGWNYFNGRITGSTVAQKVHKPEAEALAKAMKSGKLDKATEHFAKNTVFTPITG